MPPKKARNNPVSKLYVSDLDGTLLNGDGVLSDFSRTTLNQLIAEGLQFTAASGRGFASMQEVLKGLHLRLPIISYNGSFISHFDNGRHLAFKNIESNIASELLHLAHGLDCHPYVTTFDGVEDRLFYSILNNDGLRWYYDLRNSFDDPRLNYLPNLHDSLVDDAVAFTFIAEKAQALDLQTAIVESFSEHTDSHFFENIYSPDWYWLMVQDKQATKDQAVTELKTLAGITASKTVAFGDQGNDLGMVANADHGVAMSNAAPAIKMVADEVIGSHEEDSVVKYILRDFEGE